MTKYSNRSARLCPFPTINCGNPPCSCGQFAHGYIFLSGANLHPRVNLFPLTRLSWVKSKRQRKKKKKKKTEKKKWKSLVWFMRCIHTCIYHRGVGTTEHFGNISWRQSAGVIAKHGFRWMGKIFYSWLVWARISSRCLTYFYLIFINFVV